MRGVAGVRRTMKELVDGTIRVQIDIDPQYRDTFLKLFPQIDMPVAIAPLNPAVIPASTGEEGDDSEFDPTRIETPEIGQIATFSVNEAEAKEVGASTWTTLGPLCQSAIMLGKDERFQTWMLAAGGKTLFDIRRSMSAMAATAENLCAEYIRRRCGAESRKQLDESPDAKRAFGGMMAEYRKWLDG